MVDFDGTCTEHDTTPLLPRLAAFASRQRSLSESSANCRDNNNHGDIEQEDIDNEISNNTLHMHDLERRMRQFRLLEAEYLRRYGEAKSSLLGTKAQHKSIHEMLDALDEPSTIVTQMVSETRVLEGLGHVDAEELGRMLQLCTEQNTTTNTIANDLYSSEKECISSKDDTKGIEEFDKVVIRLRPGCQRTLSRVLSENKYNHSPDAHCQYCDQSPPSCWGWNIAVLSINWCPALIDASIVQPVLKQRRSVLQIDSCTTEIPIWSNQVDANGVISLHVPGALAKRDRIMELRRNIHQSSDSASVIVYVGDSSTDLAALLEADIGIIMGGQNSTSSLTTIADRWGIQIVPLKHRRQHDFDAIVRDYSGIRRKQIILWQVESWQEIDEMLLELDEQWS